MKDNILNEYTYHYKYIPQNDLKSNSIYKNNYKEINNYNREYNYNKNIENDSLGNEFNETSSNNKSFILMNEINKLKKKYLLAKEKLEIAKNQKEKDNKYIEDLEQQLNKNKNNQKFNKNDIKKNVRFQKNNRERNQNLDNKENLYTNNNSMYNENLKINNQKIKNNQSSISDFSLYDNKSFNISNNTKTNIFRNLSNINKKEDKDKDKDKRNNNKNLKRNNSAILNKSLVNKKKKNLKSVIGNLNNKDFFFTFNDNNMDDINIINKNKIIIKNCNCIINLEPEYINNRNNYLSLFQNIINNKNKNKKKMEDTFNKKIEEKKIMQERYLIIDQRQKPIYIKGKQILGMNLMPLKGDNNEIILDNDNNIFLYDLEGDLHNQKDLQTIILDNGLPLVNDNNIPLLGINNIPIIDKYGDFLLGDETFFDEDNNYTKGTYADVLRDKEGKPIKILIEKKQNNQNMLFNNYLNKKNINNFHKKNLLNNNPLIEIEIKPYTKLITSKDKNYYYYFNNKRNLKSPYNDKNKFSFEKSLRNYK